MNPNLLLAHFDAFTNSPEGVRRLRHAILEFAMQGRLVNQDLADEPVSRLLTRIEGEVDELVHAREIRRPKPVKSLSLSEVNFSIPRGWEAVRAGSIFTFITSGSRGWAEYYSTDGALFIRIGNLDYETTALDLSDVQHVRPPKGVEGARTLVRGDDILISITGDTGMVGLVPAEFPEAYINQHIALARPSKEIDPKFVALFFTSPSAIGQLHGRQRGIKNSLGLEDIRNVVVPLPPLAEQQRIVREVEILMEICNALESELRVRDDHRKRLLESAFVHTLELPL